MALTRYPIPDTEVVTAEATATATAAALTNSDIGVLLTDILTELKIITLFIQQGLNVEDEVEQYRKSPNTNL